MASDCSGPTASPAGFVYGDWRCADRACLLHKRCTPITDTPRPGFQASGLVARVGIPLSRGREHQATTSRHLFNIGMGRVAGRVYRRAVGSSRWGMLANANANAVIVCQRPPSHAGAVTQSDLHSIRYVMHRVSLSSIRSAAWKAATDHSPKAKKSTSIVTGSAHPSRALCSNAVLIDRTPPLALRNPSFSRCVGHRDVGRGCKEPSILRPLLSCDRIQAQCCRISFSRRFRPAIEIPRNHPQPTLKISGAPEFHLIVRRRPTEGDNYT